MNRLKSRYIGDKAFYRYVMSIAIPIIIQSGITNFVSMLDNIMVGQVGTLQMSAVSIANQYMFIFNLCIFGAVAGPGIFTAQFHGNEDNQGIRYTLRYKVYVAIIIVTVGSTAFLTMGEKLISMYLTAETNSPEDNAVSMYYGVRYLRVMVIGLPAFALSNAYSGTLRETEQTRVPMVAGISAVLVNLVLNYVLIFGHFGAPEMGVVGAGVATVISRYVELSIVAIWTHTHPEKNPFIIGVYRSGRIPFALFKKIFIKGMPLLFNEMLWSSGMALMNQCYSHRGLDVVAATNINSTINMVASIVHMSMGNVVGIIMGRLLGAGRSREEVLDTNRKLIFFSICSCFVAGFLMFSISGVFPQIYNTTDNVRHLATQLIMVNAVLMSFHAYSNAAYFTLRSGGQTVITFLFDSCFIWAVSLPLTYLFSYHTTVPTIIMYAICQSAEGIKVFIGTIMIKKGKWIQNLTA